MRSVCLSAASVGAAHPDHNAELAARNDTFERTKYVWVVYPQSSRRPRQCRARIRVAQGWRYVYVSL